MIQQEIEQLIEPLLNELGYVLWGSEFRTFGRNALFRLYIDKPNGIGIEDCERVSRQVSALLDVEDPIGARYTLEVSSPGLPRPLFKSKQYQAYLGQEVSLKLGILMNGTRKIIGSIESVTEDHLTIKSGEQALTVPFASILKAHLTAE